MVLTRLQLELLRQGFDQAENNKEAWQAVFQAVGMNFVGCTLRQQGFDSRQYKVVQMVLTANSCIFFMKPFYEECKYTREALCHFQNMEFNLNRYKPGLIRHEIILGCPPGYGYGEQNSMYLAFDVSSES
ncbi:hypothetical protein KW782_00830 [Candidatus Parcubacteria bacterium]|nr:hypothetical protein [Candidatus Parcubacteria bacterium]